MAAVKKSYKYCLVPMCRSTTIKTPNKMFFVVPFNIKRRQKWCKVMNRDLIGPKSTVYVCGDHFDIENDMENYIKYKLVGGMLKLKNDVVPHKFLCQRQRSEVKEQKKSPRCKFKIMENDPIRHKVSVKHKKLLTDECMPNNDFQEDPKRRLTDAGSPREVCKKRKKINLESSQSYDEGLQRDEDMLQDVIEFEDPLEVACTPDIPDISIQLSEIKSDFNIELSTNNDPEPHQESVIPKVRELIVRVYRYLQTEYEQLKNITGHNCDLSPLANILKRTAAATGVSEQTVSVILEECSAGSGSDSCTLSVDNSEMDNGNDSPDEDAIKVEPEAIGGVPAEMMQTLATVKREPDDRLSGVNDPLYTQCGSLVDETPDPLQITVKCESLDEECQPLHTPDAMKARKTHRQKRKQSFTDAKLNMAIELVTDGTSVSEVSRSVQNPQATSQYRRNARNKSEFRKAKLVLSVNEEKYIIDWIQKHGKLGSPVTKQELLAFVTKFVQDSGRPEPEACWFRNFMKKYRYISKLVSCKNLAKFSYKPK